MGRLSTVYAKQPVTYRVPYSMTGFLDFPEVTDLAPYREQTMNPQMLLHSQDKPFEVHRLIPVMQTKHSGVFSAGGGQEFALSLPLVSLKLRSRNQAITASETMVSNLVKGSAEFSWEFDDPMVLVRGEGVIVTGGVKQRITNSIMRLYVTLQGYLLIMPPASDQR